MSVLNQRGKTLRSDFQMVKLSTQDVMATPRPQPVFKPT